MLHILVSSAIYFVCRDVYSISGWFGPDLRRKFGPDFVNGYGGEFLAIT
jgi:hypothetical protein